MNIPMPKTGETSDRSGWLIGALRAVFAPMVRLCLGHVSYRAFADILLEIYISEGRKFLDESENRKSSKSELSLLTGVDSRAIDKFLAERDELLSTPKLCVESAILERWLEDPEFLDDEGDPRALLPSGPGASFQRLASTAGRGVSYQSLLERFVEEGLVDIGEDALVRLASRSYNYPTIVSSLEEKMKSGFTSMAVLGMAVDHNCRHTPARPGMIERRRWSNRINSGDVPALREDARKLTKKQITEGEALLAKYEQPLGTTDDVVCYGIGWYHWQMEAPEFTDDDT